MQDAFGFSLPASDWQAPDMGSLPDLSHAKLVSYDSETKDPHLLTRGPGSVTNDAHIVGHCLAVDDWQVYLPIRHENGVNVDLDQANAYVRDALKTKAEKVMMNAPYDVLGLRREGIEVEGTVHDVQIAASLLDEHAPSYALNALGERYLGEKKSEAMLYDAAQAFGFDRRGAKGAIHALPPQYVGPYGEQDAGLTLRLHHKLQCLIVQDDLQSIYALETALAPCLWDMKWRGVRFDQTKALILKAKWIEDQQTLATSMKNIAGREVDLWSAESIRQVFELVGITDWPKTETGKPSFTSQWLEAHPHPLARQVKQARKLAKGMQFLDSMMEYAGYGKGRIHATTNQLRSDDYGTVSGRLSMSQPSLHQIPGRDPDIGPALRGLFLPEEGEQWISSDYSSQEPRIMMHFIAKRGFDDDHPLVKEYVSNPDADFHALVADMMGVKRFTAKTLNLGLMYGMGVRKLSDQLGLQQDEGKELLEKYHAEFPFVKKIRDLCSEKATRFQALATLAGRKCRFTHWEPTTFGLGMPLLKDAALKKWPNQPLKVAWTYKSLNRLIQGSAADQNKAALVKVYAAGITPLISIHDEICASGTPDTMETITRCMREAIPLKVPVKVDSQIAPDWGAIPK